MFRRHKTWLPLGINFRKVLHRTCFQCDILSRLVWHHLVAINLKYKECCNLSAFKLLVQMDAQFTTKLHASIFYQYSRFMINTHMLTNIFTQKISISWQNVEIFFWEIFVRSKLFPFQIPSRRAYKNRGVQRNCLPVVPFLEPKAYVHRQIVIHWLPEPLYKLSVDLKKRRGDSR